MKVQQITDVFAELIADSQPVLESAVPVRNMSTSVDLELAQEWYTRASALIERVFGRNSVYFEQLPPAKAVWEERSPKKTVAILRAAKRDWDSGYVFKIRRVVEADVFDDGLEQAEHLLTSGGYYQAAAVLAGAVLETHLRSMCEQQGIPTQKSNGNRLMIDVMNIELAKSGAFNKLKGKEITAWAAIRNSAAHGRPEEFTKDDVARMIDGVRSLVTSSN